MNLLQRRGRLGASVTLLLALLAPLADAMAGVFSVTPVRLYMTPRDRAVAVTLTNEGDTEVVLQADINNWSQKPDGTDELVLTEDLILAPPIIKLGPRARQVVRLALLKPADASRQLTYRMIIREVPEASPRQGVQIPIALALSMPVFITPPAARRQVECSAERADAKTVNVRCSNSGTAYAQVREAKVSRGDKVLARFEGGNYILPGAAKTIALKSEEAVPPGESKLVVTFDDGKSINTSVTLP